MSLGVFKKSRKTFNTLAPGSLIGRIIHHPDIALFGGKGKQGFIDHLGT